MSSNIITIIDPRCIVNKRSFRYKQTECPNAGRNSVINVYKTTHEAYLLNDIYCSLCGFGYANEDVKTE